MVLAPQDDSRFRLLVESVVDYAIFLLSPEGVVESWNRGAEQIKGYSSSEIVGRHFSIFYSEEERLAGKCELVLERAATLGHFEEEGWRVRKDGTRFWADVVITALRDGTGKLIAYGKVTRDLSERRKEEEALRQSEERNRMLIASVKDYAIFMLGPTGEVSTWNAGAERLKGYRAQEIIGQHFSRFYPVEDVQAGKCDMELEVAEAVGRFEDEGWRVRKDGTRFWANVVITAVQSHDGALLGFSKVTRDLSERRRHEDERVSLARAEAAQRVAEENEERTAQLANELSDARDRAEEATRLKDEFLATVGHELRTPLSAILGWGRLLQTGKLDPLKTVSATDSIVRNAQAQSQIIDDLLDVSRIISGHMRIDFEIIDVASVVNSAVNVLRGGADAKGVRLQLEIEPEAGLIKGDSSRLHQVVWNLLNNAVKFTPAGGRISICVRRLEQHIQIQVSDTGQGIAPAFLPHMFDRFSQQEGNHARRAGGLGLGLSIAKHLVELHGGTLSAESDGVGRGATFTVEVPLVPSVNPGMAKRSKVSEPPSAAIEFPRELRALKVMVVDDEEDTRLVLQVVLEDGGAVVLLATSAEEALDRIPQERPDVIVSDIGMPGMDGYAFIQSLRKLSRHEGGHTPAIALTAYARAEDRRKALLAGFQNHAAKPLDPQELVVVVANAVGRVR